MALIRSTFDDFDDYLTSFVSRPSHVIVTGRGAFRSKVIQHRTDRIWMRHADVNMSNVTRTGFGAQRAPFLLGTGKGLPTILNGRTLTEALAWAAPGEEVHIRGPGGGAWFSWSFPLSDLEAAATALHGEAVRPPAGAPRIKLPSVEELSTLRRALHVVSELDVPPPEALVAELLRLTLACVHPELAEVPQLRGRRPYDVVEAMVALADAAEGQPLPLAQVCTRLGLPLRTLNAYCNAVLGIGAAAYLRRRRLHAAAAALREQRALSVTDAATRHGFWELGRFATDYRAVFGELPSETLRRAGMGRCRS